MTISGRSALVIGGGSGVGRATVLALSREGANVLAAGRTREKLEAVRKEAGPRVEIAALDATDAEATKRLVNQADPDFVVLSAGVRPASATIDGHTWESFSAAWNGDLKMAFEVGQVALSRPLRPGSVVVIVSSGAGLGGSPISGGYAGAKRMQMFLASYLQGVSDARSLGLRFVALVPKQLIAGTEIAERAATAYGERAGISAEKYMERFGTPLTADDVARVIVDVLRGEVAPGVQVLGVTGKGVEPISIQRELAEAREKFLELVGELRPELHRYCSRLTGSVIDGEDVVQETLAKAFYAISMANELPPLRPFLFRIAHNTALDLLRRYERKHAESTSDENQAAFDERPEPEVVRAALGTFLELPVAQRSAVILKDVLGCTLEEIVESTGSTLPAVKAALVRGRAGIRALATSNEKSGVKAMDPEERQKLHHYASLFNARDWDALRALIAEDARLDLVSRTERRGAGVGEYFTRYSALPDMRIVPGTLDGRPALALYKPRDALHPNHFVLLEWRGRTLTLIRDFFHVPYIAEEVVQGRAAFVPDQGEGS